MRGKMTARAHREHRAGGARRALQSPDRGRLWLLLLIEADVANRGPVQDGLVRAGRRVGQLERSDQVLFKALVEALAAQHLDDPAQEDESGVVVRVILPRREELLLAGRG